MFGIILPTNKCKNVKKKQIVCVRCINFTILLIPSMEYSFYKLSMPKHKFMKSYNVIFKWVVREILLYHLKWNGMYVNSISFE